jgi:pimeloyl-ACP methyl ester carboxylesterase
MFGHSNGALTAAQAAATFPERVQAVILDCYTPP